MAEGHIQARVSPEAYRILVELAHKYRMLDAKGEPIMSEVIRLVLASGMRNLAKGGVVTKKAAAAFRYL